VGGEKGQLVRRPRTISRCRLNSFRSIRTAARLLPAAGGGHPTLKIHSLLSVSHFWKEGAASIFACRLSAPVLCRSRKMCSPGGEESSAPSCSWGQVFPRALGKSRDPVGGVLTSATSRAFARSLSAQPTLSPASRLDRTERAAAAPPNFVRSLPISRRLPTPAHLPVPFQRANKGQVS